MRQPASFAGFIRPPHIVDVDILSSSFRQSVRFLPGLLWRFFLLGQVFVDVCGNAIGTSRNSLVVMALPPDLNEAHCRIGRKERCKSRSTKEVYLDWLGVIDFTSALPSLAGGQAVLLM